jgi:formiminotetrahydrofolate cyclodeaminase
MTGKLIDMPAGELLRKFGAGSHKPGSGSASAHLGMMAAQLLLTVVDLTGDAKRKGKYSQHLTRLLSIKEDIELRIYPELENLFQDDSEQFDKVIQLRRQRDQEQDYLKKRELSHQGYFALKIATEVPLKIAELSLQICEHAIYVFDNGFKSARGDSNVALNSAISAVGSSLSIVELNLQHRDRPVDGSTNLPRNNEEVQADKFAAYFLMPASSVVEAFETIFESPNFVIDESSALALRAGSAYELRRQCKDRRGLARVLASAEYYGGKTVNNLAKIFGVSVETMAIRLEELNLLSY